MEHLQIIIIKIYLFNICMGFKNVRCSGLEVEHIISCVDLIHVSAFCFVLRCNNVLYVRGVEEEEEDGEMKD